MILGDTIIPWLLGTFILLSLMAFAVTIRSWREMKRSPYFFLRRQAEKRLQTYSVITLIFILATVITYGFAWQTPADNTPRVAILENTKPPKEEIVTLVKADALETAAVTAGVETSDITISAETGETASLNPSLALDESSALVPQATEVLPEEFSQFEPTADVEARTNIGELIFSTEIASNYQAINPGRIFPEGYYTLYATFDYREMSDGMEWSWVWRHDGAVVDGGNELWNYGNNGLGFIYLSPEEGFQNGEYALEVWVNGELLSQSSVIMNNAAVSAGN